MNDNAENGNIHVTEAELTEWQALCDAATPGPWCMDSGEALKLRAPHGGYVAILGNLIGQHGSGGRERPDTVSANADFIAHARTDMTRLIAEVRRLRGVVDAERSDHEDTRKYWQKICMRAARDADREINQLASAMSADSDRIKKAEAENARLQSLIAAYKELDAGNKDYIEVIDWLANDVPAPIHAANRRLEAARANVAALEGGAV